MPKGLSFPAPAWGFHVTLAFSRPLNFTPETSRVLKNTLIHFPAWHRMVSSYCLRWGSWQVSYVLVCRLRVFGRY